MLRIILVGFLPDDHGHSCEVHPYGGRNALIEKKDNCVGCLIRLCLVERTHLAGYETKGDGMDGCRICFSAGEYAIGETPHQLDGSLLRIMEVFLSDSIDRSMWALYHRNHG